MKCRKIQLDECEITITPHDEDHYPQDEGYAPGVVEDIQEMIDKHGLWGWCWVDVQVRYGPLVGNATLGGCSYKDEDDFKRGGYYEQMVEEALDEVQQQAEELFNKLVG